MENGKWEMGNGKWEMVLEALVLLSMISLLHNFGSHHSLHHFWNRFLI
jgi:hypothetical protein